MKHKNKHPKTAINLMAGKEARAKQSPYSEKQPRLQSDIGSYSTEKPVWQLSKIDDEGKWGWQSIGRERWETKVLPKLRNFESMTWAEIERASGGRAQGNNSHFISIDKLCSEAQERLEAIKMDDLEQVFSLRLEGKHRVIGKRIGAILQIMWFDFEHEVCPAARN